jgi:hypothetical protein
MKKLILLLSTLLLLDVIQAQKDTTVVCKDTTLCLDMGYLNLSSFNLCSPAGGSYTGRGIVNQEFSTYFPELAGLGTDTMTYHVGTYTCQFFIFVIDVYATGPILNQEDSVICTGETVMYSINPVEFADEYLWTLTNSPIQNYSTQTPQIFIEFTSSFSIGDLTVFGRTKCGDCQPCPAFHINVKETASPTIQKGINDTIVCKNSRKTYFSEKVYDTYKWQVESGGVLFSGDNGRSVQVLWDNSPSGKLKLTASENIGCSGTTYLEISKADSYAPDIPEIDLFGDSLLMCNNDNATSYNWYEIDKNTGIPALIPGENNPYLYVEDFTKWYSVEACLETCCNPSNIFSFYASISENDPVSFSIFPNPARDKITIRSDEPLLSEFNYSIYSQLGLELSSGVGTKGLAEVNIAYLPAGFYLIRVWSDNSARFSQKILKF